MIPQEKAKELLEKFDVKHQMVFSTKRGTLPISMYDSQIKQCAINCVDEIIKAFWFTHENEEEYRYWLEVKQEIENSK